MIRYGLRETLGILIFWWHRKIGRVKKRRMHAPLPYEAIRKVAILVHCEDKKRLNEIVKLSNAFRLDGKRTTPPAPQKQKGDKKTHPSPQERLHFALGKEGQKSSRAGSPTTSS